MTEIFDYFTYGLYVVSSGTNACLIDSAMQITSSKNEEIYISFIINDKSDTANHILETGEFGLSILASDTPKEIRETFGYYHSSGINKFEGYHTYKQGDTIILNDDFVIGTMFGQLIRCDHVEDKIIFIGKVNRNDCIKLNTKKPLIYRDF